MDHVCFGAALVHLTHTNTRFSYLPPVTHSENMTITASACPQKCFFKNYGPSMNDLVPTKNDNYILKYLFSHFFAVTTAVTVVCCRRSSVFVRSREHNLRVGSNSLGRRNRIDSVRWHQAHARPQDQQRDGRGEVYLLILIQSNAVGA